MSEPRPGRGVPFDEAARASIDAAARGAAWASISGKGATYDGVGSALARIMEAVLGDRRPVLTGALAGAEVAGVRDVTLAPPRLAGAAGILETLPSPCLRRSRMLSPASAVSCARR